MATLKKTMRKIRLRWSGHVQHIEEAQLLKQSLPGPQLMVKGKEVAQEKTGQII